MKIRSLHDRVLVERLEEGEVKKGGIIIRTRHVEMRRHVIQAGAHLAATRAASIIGRTLRGGRGSRIVPAPGCSEISNL